MLSLTRCPFSLLDLPMRFTNDCRLNMREKAHKPEKPWDIEAMPFATPMVRIRRGIVRPMLSIPIPMPMPRELAPTNPCLHH